MQSAGKAYLSQLTGIRFFAAYLVICHHFLVIAPNRFANPILSAVGDVAVSLFFVLSGFVLTLSNRSAQGKMIKGRADYLVARAARLYPQYLFAFLLVAPFVIFDTFAKHPSAQEALPRLLLNAAAYLSMLQSWVPWLANAWIGPAWSLSTEAFFYISFLWLVPPPPAKLAQWIALAASAAILPVMLGHAAVAEPAHAFWYFFPPFRLGEFMLGMGIAQVFRSGLFPDRLKTASGAIFVLAMTLLAAAMIYLGPVWIRIASTVLLPVALLNLAVSRGIVARFLGSRAMVVLGDASYGLYLIQLPMFGIYCKLVGRTYLPGLHFLGYSIFAVAVSVAVHFCLEKPAAKAIKQHWRARQN